MGSGVVGDCEGAVVGVTVVGAGAVGVAVGPAVGDEEGVDVGDVVGAAVGRAYSMAQLVTSSEVPSTKLSKLGCSPGPAKATPTAWPTNGEALSTSAPMPRRELLPGETPPLEAEVEVASGVQTLPAETALRVTVQPGSELSSRWMTSKSSVYTVSAAMTSAVFWRMEAPSALMKATLLPSVAMPSVGPGLKMPERIVEAHPVMLRWNPVSARRSLSKLGLRRFADGTGTQSAVGDGDVEIDGACEGRLVGTSVGDVEGDGVGSCAHARRGTRARRRMGRVGAGRVI